MAIAFNNQNNSIGIGSTSSSGFTTSISITTTGNIGIGTTNPTSKLWVGGDGKFIGSVTSSGFYVDGNLIGSGSGTVGSIVGTALSVSGISTLSSTVNIGGVIQYLDNNIRIGDADTGCSIVYGGGEGSASHNFFAGSCAGRCNTSGSYNNFFGCSAGRYNTTGSFNNFFGRLAGSTNTSGFSNNFFGVSAGRYNTTGQSNNFFGNSAGFANTTGCYNNFFGKEAGKTNSTGCNNNFLGNRAGNCNTSGGFNNFFGYYAGLCNTTGCNNNFLGFSAGRCNTTGFSNNFIGSLAGLTNISGHNNNFFGVSAGRYNTTGSCNNFLGRSAGYANTTGCFNNFFGSYAGCANTTGSCNNFLGRNAGCTQTAGNRNIALGYNVQLPILTGSDQLNIGSDTNSWISGNSSFNVGIGTTNPTSKLHVAGNGYFSGIVTSSEFVGGGSDLRNLSGTHLVSYASASDISNSALSIAGINTYTQVGILTGSLVGSYDYFGNSVATSADGKTIIVGAYFDDTGTIIGEINPETGEAGTTENNSGVVYVYDRVGNSYNQVGILTGTYAVNDSDRFGGSVATSADGKTIIVGAYDDEIGANTSSGIVYVYDRVGNSFNQVGILTGSLAVDTFDQFGRTVATSADGKTIIVGANGDEISASNAGVVYVFDRVGSSFNQVGILTGTYAVNASDSFGFSVATSADGKTIIVGAASDEIGATTSTGVVYVYDRVGSSFNQVGILTGSLATNSSDNFGISVATSADGKTIIVGASADEIGANTSTGVVYVFDRVGSSFNQVGILTGSFAVDVNDRFGNSVATSADGKTIIVGASADEIGATTTTGVVYVFNRQGNSFNQVGILTGSLAVNNGDNFGISVAVSADGKTIITGAYMDEISGFDTGLVYVFDQTRETYVYSGPTGNIGIGTTNPTSKLHVVGDIRVGINTSQGVILSSANGTKYRLLVSDAGVLSTSLVT